MLAGLIAVDRQPLPGSIVGISYGVLFALLVLAAVAEPNWWGLGRAAIATVGLAVLGLLVPRDRAGIDQDARELAQLVAAPLAFLSWWTFGWAASVALVLAGATALARRQPRVAAVVSAAAITAALLPVP